MTEPAHALWATRLPLAIRDLDKINKATATLWGEVFMRQHGRHIIIQTAGEPCWCEDCQDRTDWVIRLSDQTAGLEPGWGMGRGMIVCPDCGNKRCPHASSHEEDCTRSNEPGQPGSRYR